MGSVPSNAAALDDGAPARAELACACCWASSSALRFFAILDWFCFRSKFCLTRGRFFSYTSSRKLGLGNDDAAFDRLAECNLDFNRALPTQPRSVSFLPVADFTHVDVGPSGVHRVTTTWNQSAFGDALPVAPLCAMVRHIWDLVHGG